MNKKIIALFLLTLAILPAIVFAAKPENSVPWKAVGKKFVFQNDAFGTCIMMRTGKDGNTGLQYWWNFNAPFTLEQGNQPWIAPNNDLLGTSGTKLHAVGKPVSSMTLEQAITRGYDIIWASPWGISYYVKYNWIK